MAPNGETIRAVNQVANWCEKRAKEFADDASQQFRLIKRTVIGGLILILILPPLIGQIDNLAFKLFLRAPPVGVVKDTRESVQRLGEQVKATETLVSERLVHQQSMLERLGRHSVKSKALLERAEKLLSAPFQLGRIVAINKNRSGTTIFAQTSYRDRVIYAAGRERGRPDSMMAVYRSSRGEIWSPFHPTGSDGSRLFGTVAALAVDDRGTLFAAGSEKIGRKILMSILRSRRGNKLKSAHPVDSQMNRLAGAIFALALAKNGTVFAANFRRSRYAVRGRIGENWP